MINDPHSDLKLKGYGSEKNPLNVSFKEVYANIGYAPVSLTIEDCYLTRKPLESIKVIMRNLKFLNNTFTEDGCDFGFKKDWRIKYGTFQNNKNVSRILLAKLKSGKYGKVDVSNNTEWASDDSSNSSSLDLSSLTSVSPNYEMSG
jgi:hypothetical protein